MLWFLFLFGLALGADTYPPSTDEPPTFEPPTDESPTLEPPTDAPATVQPPTVEPTVMPQGESCPSFWYGFEGRCYKYVSTRLTWADAELFCVSEGANLVSIFSKEEDDFIRSLISQFDHSEGFTWIGLSDVHKEGSWMWSDGCPVKFVFWAEGEPDVEAGEYQDCANSNSDIDKKWNDTICSNTYPSVCASRVSSCPL